MLAVDPAPGSVRDSASREKEEKHQMRGGHKFSSLGTPPHTPFLPAGPGTFSGVVASLHLPEPRPYNLSSPFHLDHDLATQIQGKQVWIAGEVSSVAQTTVVHGTG